jgi:hypothetical protein
MHLEKADAMRRAAAADHGTLATLHASRGADLVPACFAIAGEWLAIPIDSLKPKRSTALGRIRNLERDPRATLLVEHWDAADWSRLWWVKLSLRRADSGAELAEELERGLRDRYPQYAREPFVALLTFRIEAIGGWSAA